MLFKQKIKLKCIFFFLFNLGSFIIAYDLSMSCLTNGDLTFKHYTINILHVLAIPTALFSKEAPASFR